MTLEVTETEYCKLNVKFTATKDLVKEKKQQAVKVLNQRKARVPGFRPGKASAEAIFYYLKSQVSDLVSQELVRHAHQELEFQKEIKTMFLPTINKIQLEGNTFNVDFDILKRPDVKLAQYKSFDIPKPDSESIEDVCHKLLQELRTAQGDVHAFEDNDVVALNDRITIDLLCEIDGVKSEELSKEGMLYVVGQTQVLPQLEEVLLGMKAGETQTFEVKEKEENFKFTVTVHMGLKNIPAALDDSLATRLGFENFDKLQERVHGVASETVKKEITGKIQKQLLNQLVELNEVKVPEFLSSLEAQNIVRQTGNQWSGLSEEQKNDALKAAEKSVKLSLILDAVRDAEPELIYSERELLEMLGQLMVNHGQDPQKGINEMIKTGAITGAIANIRDTLTIEWLVKNCNIVE